MKIVCSQDDLLGRLQIAARGVSQRSTVQILPGVLVRAEAQGPVELAATDMELSVRVTVTSTYQPIFASFIGGAINLTGSATMPIAH